MEDVDKKPTLYERERLYGEVWAEPVKIVAARYGVSDVALAKTCRKLAIPLPGRGYWARLRAGQKVKREPLPPLPQGVPRALRVVRFTPRPERTPSEVTQSRMAEESTPEAKITVSETLERPHPLVRDTHKRFTMRNPPPVPRLDISVDWDSRDRALRIMDALIKALVSRGLTVEVAERREKPSTYGRYPTVDRDPSGTRVKIEEEWVTFGIEEKSRVVIPDPPQPPAHLRGAEREQRIAGHRPTREYEYNGVLALRIKNDEYLDVRREWKDGVRKKLEDQLNDVVAHLHLTAEALRERRRALEQAERARIEQELRKYEEDLRRQKEERKAKELSELLGHWRLARDIREFVAEALNLGADSEEMLAWALRYADQIDPLAKLREKLSPGEDRGSPEQPTG